MVESLYVEVYAAIKNYLCDNIWGDKHDHVFIRHVNF